MSVSKGGGIFGLNIGNVTKKKSPHANCQYSKDIPILISEVEHLNMEKWNCIEKIKPKLQMNYAMQKLDQLRSYMTRLYIEELAKTTTDVIGNLSVNVYRLILRDIQNNILATLRNAFRDDEFDVISERNFENYFDDKMDFILSEMLEMLDDNYAYETDINRTKLQTLNNTAEPKIREIFKDIFVHARMVSLDTNVKVLEYDERKQILYDKYLVE